MKKFFIIIFLFILAFFLGVFIAHITTPPKQYKNAYYSTEISCRTKNKINITLTATLHYDNNDKKSDYIIKKAIKESCEYVFQFYNYKDVINNKAEICALTLEDIFNRLQDQGFVIYNFNYEIKDIN